MDAYEIIIYIDAKYRLNIKLYLHPLKMFCIIFKFGFFVLAGELWEDEFSSMLDVFLI